MLPWTKSCHPQSKSCRYLKRKICEQIYACPRVILYQNVFRNGLLVFCRSQFTLIFLHFRRSMGRKRQSRKPESLIRPKHLVAYLVDTTLENLRHPIDIKMECLTFHQSDRMMQVLTPLRCKRHRTLQKIFPHPLCLTQ